MNGSIVRSRARSIAASTSRLPDGDRAQDIFRALTLEIRHLLEGEWRHDTRVAGDLEQRLQASVYARTTSSRSLTS